MNTIKHYLGVIILVLLTTTLTACGGSGQCNNNQGGNTFYTLGILPNGSTVYSDNYHFTTNKNSFTSGLIGLQGGTPGTSYLMSFSMTPTGAEVVCKKTPCVLTAGSTTDNIIPIEYLGNNAPGTYTITVYYTPLLTSSTPNAAPIPTALTSTITLVVTDQSSPESGVLMITSLAKESIAINESTTATVVLSGSQEVTTPIAVMITSESNGIINVTPSQCSLTTNSNTCTVELTGLSVGTTTFSASANGYNTVYSESISVTKTDSDSNFMIVGSNIITDFINNQSNTLFLGMSATHGIAQYNGKTIAVGSGIYSTDNESTWNLLPSKTLNTLNGITVTNTGKFVTVGDNGTILVSTDGNNWTIESSTTDKNLNAVAYNNESFIAVGDDGIILSSKDAITWTILPTTSIQDLYSVTISNNRQIVAVGQGNTVTTSTDDGVTWSSQQLTGAGFGSIRSVVVNNNTGVYVIVGDGNSFYSSDGTSWTVATDSGGGTVRLAVAVNPSYGSNGVFIAVGGNNKTFSSRDGGVTWTEQGSIQTGNTNLTSITYADSKFITGGSMIIATSPTQTGGGTWKIISPQNVGTISSVAVNNENKFVAVGNGGLILSSNDKESWVRETSNTNNWLQSITVSNTNRFIAVGVSGTVLTSDNGTTWKSETAGTASTLYSIVSNNDKLITVGSSGTIMMSSDDGVSWISQNSDTSEKLSGIARTNTHGYIVVGDKGIILTSNDGSSWVTQSSNVSYNLRKVTVSSEGKYVIVGDDSHILYSADGITWTEQTSDTTNVLNDVAVNSQGEFVIVGWAGTILTSIDGENWINQPTEYNLYYSGILAY